MSGTRRPMNGILSRDEQVGSSRSGAADCPFVATVRRAESPGRPGYYPAVEPNRFWLTAERINFLQNHSGVDDISTARRHHGKPAIATALSTHGRE